MLNCKQTSHLVSQSLERKLNWRESVSMSLHLMICAYCRRFLSQIKRIRVSLKYLVTLVEEDNSIKMSSEAKASIANAIEADLGKHQKK